MGAQQRSEGRTIAKRRRMLGLTQHELCRATNMGLNRLVFFETGRCELLPEEIDSIRTVLKKRARRSLEMVEA
jgi:hypothetical protein